MANDLVKKLKDELQKNAARKPLPSREPIKQFFRECYREHRLAKLIDAFCKTERLKDEPLGAKFKRRRTRCMCENATEARKRLSSIPKSTDINGLFKAKATAVDRLHIIREYDESIQGDALRLLVKVETRILNNDAVESDLSGGQRAEYLFLNEIAKAKGKDIVLIDEPESSFDNLFLSKEIVAQLRLAAKSATVFLATHNNALGVSLEPDCVIYAEKDGDDYRLYSGALSAVDLTSPDGSSVSRVEVLLNTMEAGKPAYERRKVHYGFAED